MGTHNRLLRLGDDVYLEVIALNPAAAAPGRPRWFGMDSVPSRPGLASWVARTDSIDNAPAELGAAEAMSRGDLSWRLTVTADGTLPMGGVAPALIEWPQRNPAHRMPDLGCRLERLELLHPQPAALEALLQKIGAARPVSVVRSHIPALRAHILTPAGRCTLS